MHTQQFSHMRGGKIFGTILILLSFFLIATLTMVFVEKAANLFTLVILLTGTTSFAWFTYKFYKPAFTDVVFSEDGILSKTLFEWEKLSPEDLKGIWYYRNKQGVKPDIKPYAKGENLKGCVLILGDIERFEDAGFIGLDGITLLHDSFKPGYTTLHYRKKLDEILAHYHRKIQKRPQPK